MLQNRKRQEKLQKDRRKKDLLALTLVKHGSQSDGKDDHWKRKMLTQDSVDDGRGYSGGRRAILTRSESSDNVPAAEYRGKHLPPPPPYNHHDDIAGVHGHNKHKALNSSNDEQAVKKHGLAKVDGATKMGMKREEKLERVQKVEQMTVHTVITTREKVHQNNGGEDQKSSTAKHLPSITGGAIRRNSESGNTSLESFRNAASSQKKKQPKNKRQVSTKITKSAFFGQSPVMSDYASSSEPEQVSENDSVNFSASEDLHHE